MVVLEMARRRMEILSATILDLRALHKLERVCFGPDAWPLVDLIGALSFPDVVRLKAVEQDEMIGFAAGDARPRQGFSWIATIAVLPESRRRGVGRRLLRACEAHLRTSRLRLSVRASNVAAIRLYQAEHYDQVDVLHNYYRDGETAIVMQKDRKL
jgi:ribosomal protein S18 acetylase RimI-like enzyme